MGIEAGYVKSVWNVMKCNAFSEELKNTYLFSIFKNSYFNISISKIIIYLKFKKKK